MASNLSKVILKGFKKCCISSGDETVHGVLWNGSKEDGNVRSECEEDEVTDSEDGDSVSG